MAVAPSSNKKLAGQLESICHFLVFCKISFPKNRRSVGFSALFLRPMQFLFGFHFSTFPWHTSSTPFFLDFSTAHNYV